MTGYSLNSPQNGGPAGDGARRLAPQFLALPSCLPASCPSSPLLPRRMVHWPGAYATSPALSRCRALAPPSSTVGVCRPRPSTGTDGAAVPVGRVVSRLRCHGADAHLGCYPQRHWCRSRAIGPDSASPLRCAARFGGQTSGLLLERAPCSGLRLRCRWLRARACERQRPPTRKLDFLWIAGRREAHPGCGKRSPNIVVTTRRPARSTMPCGKSPSGRY